MPYQIALNWDNAAGLEDAAVQPKSTGIKDVRRYAVSGHEEKDLLHTEWVFTVLTAEEFSALLTQFGLTSSPTRNVTVRTRRNSDRTFVNANAIISEPIIGSEGDWELGFYRNVVFRLKGVRLI